MPLTIAHPAAVLPLSALLKEKSILSALVIGSMAPDVSHFVPLRSLHISSHTLAGTVFVCLPVGLATYLIFHFLLKRPLASLLPLPISQRITENRLGVCPVSLGHLFLVSLCVVIGAGTHILWDAFTHQDTYFVQHIAGLQKELTTLGGYTVSVFKILQHGSTLLGLAVLGIAACRWHSRTPAAKHNLFDTGYLVSRNVDRLIVIGLPTLAAITSGWQAIHSGPWMQVLRQVLHRGIIAFGQTLVVCVLAYALVWWIIHRLGPTFPEPKGR